MMNFNENERRIQEQLKKEAEIPAVVHDRVNQAYRMIEDHKVRQKDAPRDPFRWMKTGGKIAGGMAAAMAVGFVFCAANPVMARELPVVGGLFEKLQDEVSFFGDFADKATVLEETGSAGRSDAAVEGSGNGNDAGAAETGAGGSDAGANASGGGAAGDANAAGSDVSTNGSGSGNDAGANGNGNGASSGAAAADTAYTKTDDGLTVTCSEIYANDQVAYLTMQFQSDEPFPDTMIDQEGKPVIELLSTHDFDFTRPEGAEDLPEDCTTLEGKFLDDHTYACILRIDYASSLKDFSEYNQKYDEMVQDVLDEMGVSMDDLDDETDEGYALLEEFNDKVLQRAGALQSYIKTSKAPESFNMHLDITKFIGTKAEPEVWDSGYSEEELSAMSDEEFRNVMNQMPEDYQISPNEHQNYWFEGNWSFDIPVKADTSRTEIQELNETGDDGIGLASVTKTPYELTVKTLYKDGADSDNVIVLLDADGNRMTDISSSGTGAAGSDTITCAIQDRDISTVDVYFLDYMEYMNELKGVDKFTGNEDRPAGEKWGDLLAQHAKYHKTLHFNQ